MSDTGSQAERSSMKQETHCLANRTRLHTRNGDNNVMDATSTRLGPHKAEIGGTGRIRVTEAREVINRGDYTGWRCEDGWY